MFERLFLTGGCCDTLEYTKVSVHRAADVRSEDTNGRRSSAATASYHAITLTWLKFAARTMLVRSRRSTLQGYNAHVVIDAELAIRSLTRCLLSVATSDDIIPDQVSGYVAHLLMYCV